MRRDERQTRKLDGWIYAVLVLALLQAVLFVTLHARPGRLGVILWYVGPLGLGVLSLIVLVVGVTWSAVRRPFWASFRGAGYLGLGLIMAVSAKAYRVYPSSHDHSPSLVQFRLPLEGPVTVAWGGGTMDANYHVVAPDQRWAYDLLVTRDGRSFRGTGEDLEDYYAFGLPVLAPAAGTVRLTLDGEPNLPIGGTWDGSNATGNHVVIEVAPDEFLFVAHLQAGSVAVSAGERVYAGQQVGLVGNSGRSTEPHVHLHLQDTPYLHLGEGIPLFFYGYRAGGRFVGRGMPTGGIEEGRFVGEVVEQVGDSVATPRSRN